MVLLHCERMISCYHNVSRNSLFATRHCATLLAKNPARDITISYPSRDELEILVEFETIEIDRSSFPSSSSKGQSVFSQPLGLGSPQPSGKAMFLSEQRLRALPGSFSWIVRSALPRAAALLRDLDQPSALEGYGPSSLFPGVPCT
jgi:hypothetical protein